MLLREIMVYSGESHEHDSGSYYLAPQVKQKSTTPKPIAPARDDDWKSLGNSITYLFHKKQLQKLELDILNEKVRNVHSQLRKGTVIVECYKESILKKGM